MNGFAGNTTHTPTIVVRTITGKHAIGAAKAVIETTYERESNVEKVKTSGQKHNTIRGELLSTSCY